MDVYTITYTIISINVSTINRPYERLHVCTSAHYTSVCLHVALHKPLREALHKPLHEALHEVLHEVLLKLCTSLCLKLLPCCEARRRDRICEVNLVNSECISKRLLITVVWDNCARRRSVKLAYLLLGPLRPSARVVIKRERTLLK